MPAPLSGPGVGLQLPQNLYPSELFNAPYDFGNNLLTLQAGDTLPIPAGQWFVNPGAVSFIQFLDPVTGIWRIYQTPRGQFVPIRSDGYTARVANLTGCPIAAVVTNAGSGYVQASTTCTAGTGNSTWSALVGGMVSLSTISVAGAGYGIPPLVFLTAPPPGGVQASAYATLTGTSVTGITMVNWGAGYTSAPTGIVLPSPNDPNINAGITAAQVVFTTFGSGSISAILCTNPGVSIAVPTLTIAGAGSSATATALRLTCMTGLTVGGSPTGWTGGANISTSGNGTLPSAVNTNPYIELLTPPAFMPRPAQAFVSGATLNGTPSIMDPGLFLGTSVLGTATPVNGVIPTAGATGLTITQGGITDTIIIQPAP
jgi:hypothetical protein